MEYQLWSIISLLALAFVFFFFMFFFKKNGDKKPDYYSFFILGMMWAAVGIPLKNYAMSGLGAVFMIAGLAHKDQWKEQRIPWAQASKQEKVDRRTYIAIFLFVLLAALINLAIQLSSNK